MLMPNIPTIVQGEISYLPLIYLIGYTLLLFVTCTIYLKVKDNVKLMSALKRIGYLPFISILLFILGSLYATYNLTDISVFYVLFKILSIIAILVISCILVLILIIKVSNYIDEDRKRNGYIEEDTISESVSESELTISKDKVEETIKETENQEKEEKDVVNE